MIRRLAFGFALFVTVAGLSACTHPLPAISHPDALLQECASLDASVPDGEIDSSKWSDSIKALHPVRVERRGDSVLITTFQQTGEGVRGYLINGKEEPTISRYTLTRIYAGVYSFDFIP